MYNRQCEFVKGYIYSAYIVCYIIGYIFKEHLFSNHIEVFIRNNKTFSVNMKTLEIFFGIQSKYLQVL